jgi:hypothetical protein
MQIITEVLEYRSKLLYPYVIYESQNKDRNSRKVGCIQFKQKTLRGCFNCIPKTILVRVEVMERFPEGEEK